VVHREVEEKGKRGEESVAGRIQKAVQDKKGSDRHAGGEEEVRRQEVGEESASMPNPGEGRVALQMLEEGGGEEESMCLRGMEERGGTGRKDKRQRAVVYVTSRYAMAFRRAPASMYERVRAEIMARTI